MCPNNKAFTLIELLVVVLIIGILAAVAMPQYQMAAEKARYMELITLGESLRKAEEIYYLTHGEYTKDITALDWDIPDTDNIYYFLQNTASDAYVLTYHEKSPDLWYLIYLDHHPQASWRGKKQCRAGLNNEVQKKLCQNITGHQLEKHEDYWLAYF